MSTTLDELLQSLESDASGVEKQASDSTPNTNTTPGEQNEMSKEAAYEYGRALARELVKRANQITENDRAIQDVQASQVLPVPDGTVNDVLRGIMARDQERGFEDLDPDLEALLGRIAEGNADGHLSDEIRMALMGGASPEQRGTGKLIATESAADEVEKAAAVNALVDAGISFDDAAELVKAAGVKNEISRATESLGRVAKSKKGKIGAGLAALGALGAGGYALKRHLDEDEGEESEKAAAVSALVAAGLPFEDASELVKAAGVKDELRRAKEGLGRVAKSKKGKIGAGVVGAGALAGLASHMYAQGKTDREDESEGEKAAAVSALVAAGLPFEDASELVKAAAEEEERKRRIGTAGKYGRALGRLILEGNVGALAGLPLLPVSPVAAGVVGTAGQLAGMVHGAAKSLENTKRKNDLYDKQHPESEGEKAAAVNALVNAGLPFEDAASLVKAAAYELDKEASNDDLIAEILANLQG